MIRHSGGEASPQGQERMQFDGGLVSAEFGPREQRQTQIDGRGVQRVGGLFQLGAERFCGVEQSGLCDQDVGEIGEDAPVAFFVRGGQGAARGGLPDPAVIEFGTQGVQTRLDVAQALAVGQSREAQDQELFVGESASVPDDRRGNGVRTCRIRIWAVRPSVGQTRFGLR